MLEQLCSSIGQKAGDELSILSKEETLKKLYDCQAFYVANKDHENNWLGDPLVEIDREYPDGTREDSAFVTKYTHFISDVYSRIGRAMMDPSIVSMFADALLELYHVYKSHEKIDFIISMDSVSAPLAYELTRRFECQYVLEDDIDYNCIPLHSKVVFVAAEWHRHLSFEKFYQFFCRGYLPCRAGVRICSALAIVNTDGYNVQNPDWGRYHVHSLATVPQQIWQQNDNRVREYINTRNHIVYAWERESKLWAKSVVRKAA